MSSRIKRFLLLLLWPLTACTEPTTTINYHQTAVCRGSQGQPGDQSTDYNAGPQHVYVVFGVEGIDNSQNPATFNFDPTKMYVNGAERNFVDPNLPIYKWVLDPFTPAPTLVAGGGTIYYGMRGQNALVVETVNVETANTNGSAKAHQTAYSLNYKTGVGDPKVVMIRTDSSALSLPNKADCAEMVLQ